MGQNNLVPNGNFETYSDCPDDISQISRAIPWYSPTDNGSPEYYNQCSEEWIGVSVPDNGCGYQLAHSANAYAGIFAFHKLTHNQREFLQVELNDTIIKGIPYIISFWLSLTDNQNYSVNTMGAYLSEEAINDTQINTFDLIPQVMNNPVYPLSDKENWMLIKDTFISTIGGELFITIGNFFDDSESDTLFLNSGEPNWVSSYYYIDDVSVIAVDTTIGIEDYDKNKVKVYPNPANESFIIEYTVPIVDGVIFELYDLSGRKVKVQNIYNNRTVVETGNLDAGIYHYALRDNSFFKYSGKQIIIK